jgi:hypothetical protein
VIRTRTAAFAAGAVSILDAVPGAPVDNVVVVAEPTG